MSTSESIQRKKKLYDLPFHKDQLEYWGPIDHGFANSFLTMGDAFLKQFFAKNVKLYKAIFSSFVELVQNVSEYNEMEYKESLPQSYVNLKIDNQFVIIQTINKLESKDVDVLEDRLKKLFESTPEEIKELHKKTLMGGGSLGFFMIKKLENTTFEYEFSKEDSDTNWLSLELKINYGSTTD